MTNYEIYVLGEFATSPTRIAVCATRDYADHLVKVVRAALDCTYQKKAAIKVEPVEVMSQFDTIKRWHQTIPTSYHWEFVEDEEPMDDFPVNDLPAEEPGDDGAQ